MPFRTYRLQRQGFTQDLTPVTHRGREVVEAGGVSSRHLRNQVGLEAGWKREKTLGVSEVSGKRSPTSGRTSLTSVPPTG